MDACKFLSAFENAFTQVQPTGYWKTWTTPMYSVFDQVGNSAGYLVRHKNKIGEAYHFDVIYFRQTNNIKTNWYPPYVVIEHENSSILRDAQYDFTKLCICIAALRVMIAYGTNQYTALSIGNDLIATYVNYGYQQVPNGETLLMVGWDHLISTNPFHYHLWLIRDASLPLHLPNVATDQIAVTIAGAGWCP
jgi:hypothetical protein